MSAFYNEFEAYPAQWLRNLAGAGHIAPGVVDDRSITEVTPDALQPHTQAHFFAGIGVWSHALRLAGWADDRPVWTGSCPCQPFSVAGRGLGVDDPRHLWPVWFRLIKQCRPPVVFGEQVASPDGLAWLDAVHADLEGAGYAFGAADLCAAGVGAPHIRQRLYFAGVRLADADSQRREQLSETRLHVDGPLRNDAARRGSTDDAPTGVRPWGRMYMPSPWGNAQWSRGRDGVSRPLEPGVCPLVDGSAIGLVAGNASQSADWAAAVAAYGNAIVSEVAATFIRAVMEVSA